MFSSITSFITSSISSLPFKLTSEEVVHPSASVASGGGIWKHYQAIRVTAGVTGAIASAGGAAIGDPVSVFTFDKKIGTSDQLTLAKNALIRLKTLRHPNIVKFIDSVDLPTHLHILTEPVVPLLFEAIKPSDHVGQLAASLGLYQVATTLSWLNNDAKLVHSNLHPGSLFTTDSGDWKLFGFDLCYKGTENIPDAILTGRNSGILPVQYRAPEFTKHANSAAPPAVLHATDAWSLGCLIYQTFNANFESPQQLAAAGNIPSALTQDYKKLLATNPVNRLNPKQFLDGPFFQNELVSTVTFLENLAIHSASEKDQFFIHFSEHISEFPSKFCKYKILPQLTQSLDYGSGLTCFSAILRSILKIGSQLTESEYANQVLPCVVKLFSSNERQIRVHLLQNLGEYAPSLSPELVNDQLFTHVLTGFGDANPTLRELTVKSLMHFAPKLSPANMDQALRWLSKLQTDPEPAIRTNTGYCLAKIAPHLTPALAEKVLIAAFTKMLRDPFPPARVAGVTALLATMEQHKPQDVARKILPCVTPLLADDVVDVRQISLKFVEGALRTMTTWSAAEKIRQDQAMTTAPNAMGSNQMNNGTPGGQSSAEASGAASAAASVIGSLGSWAVGAVRNKISNADQHPPLASQQQQQPKHSATNSMGGGGGSYGGAPSATSSLAASKPASTSGGGYGASTTAPKPASISSTFANDDFFDDFSADKTGDGDDSDDGFTPAALSTKKETKPKATSGRKDSTGEKKKEKKSILSGGSSTITTPKTTASAAPSSSSSWDFNMDDLPSTTTANQSIIDDFDDWGSSAPTPAATSTKHASTKSTSSSATFDLLSTTSHPQATKASPSSSVASDPFSALSLSGSSPKPPTTGSSLSLSSAKPKASPLGSSTIKPVIAAVPVSSAKKSGVDDWGDFLNS